MRVVRKPERENRPSVCPLGRRGTVEPSLPSTRSSRVIEEVDSLDAAADQVSQAVSRVTHRPPVSNVVGGSWIGHPVHPILTDLPIGLWTRAFVLDLVGGRPRGRRRRPSSAWECSPPSPPPSPAWPTGPTPAGGTRRVGTFHAADQLRRAWAATCCRGGPAAEVTTTAAWRWAMAGATAATAAAIVGRSPRLPHWVRAWTSTLHDDRPRGLDRRPTSASSLPGGEGRYVEAGPAKVLAIHDGPGGWHGIGARCSHRDGPLQEGDVRRRLRHVPVAQEPVPPRRREPSSTAPPRRPQPRYDVREVDGRVRQVRRR